MMHIGVLQFTLEIPYAESLKDKRRVVKSMKDRIRRTFNVSIAEVDDLDDRTVATLGAVMAGNDIPYINSALDKLLNTIQDDRDAILADHQLEILSPP
jgi:uncharacterized protein YlxP (DUF503 family)